MNLNPARTQARPVKIVADFDALVSQEIGFKLHGESYILKPVNTEDSMRLTLALERANKLSAQREQDNSVTLEDICQAYLDFISPLCPQMTMDTLKQMTLAQIHALVGLIIRHMMGLTSEDMRESSVDENGEKKNSLK